MIEAKSGCVSIFLHEHMIRRLETIKRRENNGTASFSLTVTSEDTDSFCFDDVTLDRSHRTPSNKRPGAYLILCLKGVIIQPGRLLKGCLFEDLRYAISQRKSEK